MGIELRKYKCWKNCIDFWRNVLVAKTYIILKIELNNILKTVKYYYIYIYIIILFIGILVMIYEWLPYSKKYKSILNVSTSCYQFSFKIIMVMTHEKLFFKYYLEKLLY